MSDSSSKIRWDGGAVQIAPLPLDSSPILENMHRYHTYKMHTSSCQETLRKTMEETLWEVGASRCLQVAGAGSNGLIFSQIDLLARPPPYPILNKTCERKQGWGDLMFGLLDNPYIFMDYPGGWRWKKKVIVRCYNQYPNLDAKICATENIRIYPILFILCIGPAGN